MFNIFQKKEKQGLNLREFKIAVDNASDHIVITDPDANIIYANKAVEKITGFSNEEVIGKKAGTKELWGRQMPSSFYKKMWHTIKIEKKQFQGEIKNKRKNGEYYDAEVKISPVLDEKNNVKYFVATERDITKEKDLSRMKDDFLNIAAHDLRTPMTAIKGYTNMILTGDFGQISQQLSQPLKEIQDASERLIRLVNDFLTSSRIERGKITVQSKPIDIVPILKIIAKQIEPIAKKKNLTFSITQLPAKLIVNTDQDKIQQVIINLLDNAVKYTEEGTIHLALKTDFNNAIISVKDMGQGISEDNQKKLFSKYYQVSGGKSKVVGGKGSGLGLGLYISRLIVEGCDGRIWVESEVGKGSKFSFSLPLVN